MVVYGDKVIVGGLFNQAGQNTGAKHVGAFNGTGWTSLFGGVDDYVWSLAVVGGALVVGGDFQQAGFTAVNRITIWDGTSWNPVGTGMDGSVDALGEYEGDLIAGGAFGMAGGEAAAHIARWDGAAWNALGAGLDGGSATTHVAAIAEYDGELYVGGDFTEAGGVAVTNLARWNGSQWSTVGTLTGSQGGWAHPVETLTLTSSGTLLVGGEFSHVDGVYCNGLAEWNGTTWTPRGIGLDPGAIVLATAEYHGDLVAFGYLGVPGGGSMVARWHGGGWTTLGDGLEIHEPFPGGGAVAVYHDDLYVTGNIGSADGMPSSYIARWMEPNPTAVPAQRSDTAWGIRTLGRTGNEVTFELALAQRSEVRLEITDVAGRLVQRVPRLRITGQ